MALAALSSIVVGRRSAGVAALAVGEASVAKAHRAPIVGAAMALAALPGVVPAWT